MQGQGREQQQQQSQAAAIGLHRCPWAATPPRLAPERKPTEALQRPRCRYWPPMRDWTPWANRTGFPIRCHFPRQVGKGCPPQARGSHRRHLRHQEGATAAQRRKASAGAGSRRRAVAALDRRRTGEILQNWCCFQKGAPQRPAAAACWRSSLPATSTRTTLVRRIQHQVRQQRL